MPVSSQHTCNTIPQTALEQPTSYSNHAQPHTAQSTLTQTQLMDTQLARRPYLITDWLPTVETAHQRYSAPSSMANRPLEPFGHALSPPDNARTLRIISQNTQYALQLSQDGMAIQQTIENLQTLEASIFIAISPNINWANPSHWAKFKQPF